MIDCPFCLSNNLLRGDVLAENQFCSLIETGDPVLRSSVMIIPLRHVASPFDLTSDEWIALHDLMAQAKPILDRDGPHGYSVGWNVHPVAGQSIPHAHLHVIGRFADEPLAGQGIRHALKQESNRRTGSIPS
ncbi:MAG: HIT domain-containing protein [Chloroflexota bacterium]|nr:HIT domain-containing protein [Chloroflexota bacterium]